MPDTFFYNRLIEFLMMGIVGVFMLFSLTMTAVWTAFGRMLQESELARATFNPGALAAVNNVFLKYLIPYALTVLMVFVLYKFVPEVKVHTRAGLIPAAVAALFFEAFKRAFAFYVVHFSHRHRPEQDPQGHPDLGPVLPALDQLVHAHPALGGRVGGGPERKV